MSKKYGGVIHNWRKHDMTALWPQDELNAKYGPNLGYVVTGYLFDDPTDRFGRGPIQTSLVVKFGDMQIETLNTVYDLAELVVEG